MKHRLSDYLHLKNIEFKRGFYRCPNPAHNDKTPSAKLYNNSDGQVLCCMSACNSTWDIFDIAGLLINSDKFPEQKAEVEKTLGIMSDDYTPPKAEKKKPDQPTHISIPIDKLNEVYNDDKILEYAKEKGYGDRISGKYICYSSDGKSVAGVEYRFENADNKKTVFLIWYNGKSVKWSNPPRLIFGLNEIKFGCPYLIVEGPKTREIASVVLPDFNVLTWNGGANNADKVDWCSVIPHDADVYLWPDDDEPGQKAMQIIKGILE
jgi:hypothetical protein